MCSGRHQRKQSGGYHTRCPGSGLWTKATSTTPLQQPASTASQCSRARQTHAVGQNVHPTVAPVHRGRGDRWAPLTRANRLSPTRHSVPQCATGPQPRGGLDCIHAFNSVCTCKRSAPCASRCITRQRHCVMQLVTCTVRCCRALRPPPALLLYSRCNQPVDTCVHSRGLN